MQFTNQLVFAYIALDDEAVVVGNHFGCVFADELLWTPDHILQCLLRVLGLGTRFVHGSVLKTNEKITHNVKKIQK